jgi:hypothetical protein
MLDSTQRLSTREYLHKMKKAFSSDTRLEFYEAIQAAAANVDPWCLLTITTTTPIRDVILFEGLCRRFSCQLHREVLGMRKFSKIQMIVVLESSKSGALHAHLLIGKPQGKTRKREDTTFKSYLQKKPFPALLKILHRLTYPADRSAVGKIGVIDIKPVYCVEGAVDYLLKKAKEGIPQIAWLASNVSFQNSAANPHLNSNRSKI